MSQHDKSSLLHRTTSTTARFEPVLSWLEINLDHLAHNYQCIKALTCQNHDGKSHSSSGSPAICAVLKKNAYGMGDLHVAKCLEQQGVDMLAVFSVEEAERLAQAGGQTPVLILTTVDTFQRTQAIYRLAVANRLHLSLHDLAQAESLNQVGRMLGLKLPVHVYFDTGMSRTGLNHEQLDQFLANLASFKHLTLTGLYSHLAAADIDLAFTDKQTKRFQQVLQDHASHLPKQLIRHLANSFGTLRSHALHFDMVRPGIALSGFGPEMLHNPPEQLPTLKPPLRWLSKLIHFQHYAAGASVGYQCTHTLSRDACLGVVPIGYADGYRVAFSNQSKVRVLASDAHTVLGEASVVGKVNMDQIVVDLTDLQNPAKQPWHELVIELISDDLASPNSIPALARLANTHCYEIQCGLSDRIPRRYVKNTTARCD